MAEVLIIERNFTTEALAVVGRREGGGEFSGDYSFFVMNRCECCYETLGGAIFFLFNKEAGSDEAG